MGQRLYKTGTVAEIFAVDPKTVIRWANDGRLGPVIRTPGGRHRRYDADLVDRLAGDATQGSRMETRSDSYQRGYAAGLTETTLTYQNPRDADYMAGFADSVADQREPPVRP